jgi:hypothetical protein
MVGMESKECACCERLMLEPEEKEAKAERAKDLA